MCVVILKILLCRAIMSLEGLCPMGPVEAHLEGDAATKLEKYEQLELLCENETQRYERVWEMLQERRAQQSCLDTKYSVVCMLVIFLAVYIVCSGLYIVETTVDEMVLTLLFCSSVYSVICGVLLHTTYTAFARMD